MRELVLLGFFVPCTIYSFIQQLFTRLRSHGGGDCERPGFFFNAVVNFKRSTDYINAIIKSDHPEFYTSPL